MAEAAAERDAREKLSLWDGRPDSMAPLTDRQTDSVLELKAAVENLPVPAEVRRGRGLRPASCPVRGSGRSSEPPWRVRREGPVCALLSAASLCPRPRVAQPGCVVVHARA